MTKLKFRSFQNPQTLIELLKMIAESFDEKYFCPCCQNSWSRSRNSFILTVFWDELKIYFISIVLIKGNILTCNLRKYFIVIISNGSSIIHQGFVPKSLLLLLIDAEWKILLCYKGPFTVFFLVRVRLLIRFKKERKGLILGIEPSIFKSNLFV